MSVSATKRSSCPNCDEGIKVGEPITRPDGRRSWEHVECPLPRPKDVCPECFMEKAVDGSCLC
ncbi:hypothetical protein SEA_DANNYDE_77 [Microbacterium phage DannyDe]|nr:hypothetical protein SEA_DANNYDE_77 [Microbacterium phage DannyDe]